MPQKDPRAPMRGQYGTPETEEEYRRRMAARAKRRKKRQMQRILLVVAFVLAAVLLVVCIVAIFRAIFGGGDKDKSSSSATTSISVSSEPQTGPGLSWTVAPNPDVWNLILVNGQHAVPDGFSLSTEELGTITYDKVPYYFDARIMDSLKGMIDACNAVEGNTLRVISGYRGADNQNERYNYLVTYFKGQGSSDAEADLLARQIDPPAGHSEHQTGLAVDFVTGAVAEPGEAFATTPEYTWLMEHAHEYGFILRYPSEKEAITGIKAQPYHFRYVGVEEAKIMKSEGTCLEEYLAKLPGDDSSSSSSENTSTPQSDGSTSGSDAGGDAPA